MGNKRAPKAPKTKTIAVQFEVLDTITPDELHEYLCQAVLELTGDLQQEMFGAVDAVSDINVG